MKDFEFHLQVCLHFNRKITVLKREGSIDLFNENLRDVSVYFITKGGVFVI